MQNNDKITINLDEPAIFKVILTVKLDAQPQSEEIFKKAIKNWKEIKLIRKLIYRPVFILFIETKDRSSYQRFLGLLHHAVEVPISYQDNLNREPVAH